MRAQESETFWKMNSRLFKVWARGTEKYDQWGVIWERTDRSRQIAQSYNEVDLEGESWNLNTVEGQSQVIKVNLNMLMNDKGWIGAGTINGQGNIVGNWLVNALCFP